MDYKKLLDAKISKESVGAWRSAGNKALGVVCCHVPQEILHAAGVLPVRLRATGCEDYSEAEVWMSSFSCSFAKSILQYFIDGVYELDGLIASDGCMQAVRIYDNWKAYSGKIGKEQTIIEIGAPRMSSATTKAYYREELIILADELEKLTGKKLTEEKLLRSIDLYNEARRLVKQVLELQKAEHPVITGAEALTITLAETNMPIEEYIELLKAFLADVPNMTPVSGIRARLMIIGSALDNPAYIKAIEDKGGLVVADTLCLGSMTFNDELKVDKSDILGSIAGYYLDRIVCPRMIDNRDALHRLIVGRALDYKVDGLLYVKMQNCECWGGENTFLEPALRDAGIPVLYLEREEKLANLGQLEIRAEAFIEMVEKED
ncbi:MAG: 2-hydroxyacyl-CoA dehydratase family protein [Oscillospiraceae bacterium]|nr:2-hydroxyacyl-CoA dehydratase family protein [Oscillospiraceae bacterium]